MTGSKTLLFLIAWLLASLSPAQNPNRQYKAHRVVDNILELEVSDGIYRLMPYNENIMECTFIPGGESFNPSSHAVVLAPGDVQCTLAEAPAGFTWSTAGIAVTIEKSPFRISYTYKGRLITSEKSGYIKSDSTEQLEFNLDQTEALYGGGARVLGMNRRGNLLRLYNKAHYGYETRSELMNFTMPLVLSSRIYAIHFDNAPVGYLDLDSRGDNTLRYEAISGRKTYQVVAGETWAEIMDHYTRLTGRQPMPPRWAFGNFSSRFGYHSEEETRRTVNLFLKDSIPLDAVVIDIYWFGPDIKGHMGNLEFLLDSFPTPEQMMADFRAQGVKTILVTEPFILTTSKRWDEAVEKELLATDSAGHPFTYDFYFGNTGIIDIYKPEAREWFWNIYREFTEMGVSGWWGDLGEPEVHPSGLRHATGSADEVHNIYGHDWAGLIHEGYLEDFPDQRPFILMRAGYSGSQRYGMIPWSGDVSRSWGGLVPQTEIALQMGMQGLAYMHSDLGGFAEGKVFNPELYIRWLQYGVFQPIFRPHAQEHIPAEPVFHDPATKALASATIELRYSLLPYNYSLAFENNQTGMPLMRPLFFEEPSDTSLYGHAADYLWGENFLVSPVTEPGLTGKKVRFPAGNNWFDFFTGEKYHGGKTSIIPVVTSHIPVFVRGGAFVPSTAPVQSTDEYSTEKLSVHYYFDPEAEQSGYRLYDDDGKTPDAYEKGKYEFVEMGSRTSGSLLEITLKSSPGENYKSSDRVLELTIHNLPDQPGLVTLKGQEIQSVWNQDEQILTVPIELKGTEQADVRITW